MYTVVSYHLDFIRVLIKSWCCLIWAWAVRVIKWKLKYKHLPAARFIFRFLRLMKKIGNCFSEKTVTWESSACVEGKSCQKKFLCHAFVYTHCSNWCRLVVPYYRLLHYDSFHFNWKSLRLIAYLKKSWGR